MSDARKRIAPAVKRIRESTSRQPADQRMGNEARMANARIERARQWRQEAAEEVSKAVEELAAIWTAAQVRFGRPIPFDPTLLDVLAQIEIRDGDCWYWRGVRNRYGLPTVRDVTHRHNYHEISAVRYLAIQFGVITEDDNGMLFPLNGKDDVNPWHRKLRRSVNPITGRQSNFAPKEAQDDFAR